MQDKSLTKFDFDAAMELARKDPEAFEQHRQDVIEELISRAPERNRHHLRCLQWRIDQERERASNPTDACVKIYRMMWDSFAGESGLIDTMRNARNLLYSNESQLPKAKVLSLSRVPTTRRRPKS